MKKSILPRVCKFSLTILATFVLGTVFIFANPVQAFAEEATEHVTLDQHHIDMIQEAFNGIVPPREMRMEINLQDVLDCMRTMHEIIDVFLAPVYDVIDEIVQGFMALSGPNARSNITLNEVRIDVEHELICSFIISIETKGDFIAVTTGYNLYIPNLEAFLTQNYVIEPFASPYDNIAIRSMNLYDSWNGAHSATLTSHFLWFRRIDNAIFIREGDRFFTGWGTIIDPRLVSSISVWGRAYFNNGTVNAFVSHSFRVYHIMPNGNTTGVTWIFNAYP